MAVGFDSKPLAEDTSLQVYIHLTELPIQIVFKEDNPEYHSL